MSSKKLDLSRHTSRLENAIKPVADNTVVSHDVAKPKEETTAQEHEVETKPTKSLSVALAIEPESVFTVTLSELHTDSNIRSKIDRDSDDFAKLVATIQAVGIIQPPVCERDNEGKLQVLVGHRRVAAAEKAGLEKISIVVRNHVDTAERNLIQVVENITRLEMQTLDLADAITKYKGQKTHAELANIIDRNRLTVGRLLKIGTWPDEVKAILRSNPALFAPAKLYAIASDAKLNDHKKLQAYVKKIEKKSNSKEKKGKESFAEKVEAYFKQRKLSAAIKNEILSFCYATAILKAPRANKEDKQTRSTKQKKNVKHKFASKKRKNKVSAKRAVLDTTAA